VGGHYYCSVALVKRKSFDVPGSCALARRAAAPPVSPRRSLCSGSNRRSSRHLEATSPPGATWPWHTPPPRGPPPPSLNQPSRAYPNRADSSCLTFRASPIRRAEPAPPENALGLPPSLRRSPPMPAVPQKVRHARLALHCSPKEPPPHGPQWLHSARARDGYTGSSGRITGLIPVFGNFVPHVHDRAGILSLLGGHRLGATEGRSAMYPHHVVGTFPSDFQAPGDRARMRYKPRLPLRAHLAAGQGRRVRC